MRICILVPQADTTGGSGRHAKNISIALRGAGHEVRVVETHQKRLWQCIREVRRVAKTVDIVQVVDINPLGFVGFVATRFTKARFIVVTQGSYSVAPLYNKKTALLAKIVYRSADAIVAISSYIVGEVHKKIPGLTIVVIDPGIDMRNFPGDIQPRSAPPKDVLLLSVGSIKARKGQDVSLRAFALLKTDFPGARYAIVGSQTDEPGYFCMLTSLARELGVERDVEFLTNIPDTQLRDLYSRASLFILTSVNEGFHFEGYGMVFVEADAYGVPGVGTFGNGIEDAVEGGKTGLLVAQKDPAATAAAMKTILGDPALYARMSKRGQAFAREHDLEHLVRKYEGLYRSMFKGMQ